VETDIAKPGGGGLFPKAMMRLSETRTIASNDLSFTIKPLPEAWPPVTFQGAVGSFELEVDATRGNSWPGDPLSVGNPGQGDRKFR